MDFKNRWKIISGFVFHADFKKNSLRAPFHSFFDMGCQYRLALQYLESSFIMLLSGHLVVFSK